MAKHQHRWKIKVSNIETSFVDFEKTLTPRQSKSLLLLIVLLQGRCHRLRNGVSISHLVHFLMRSKKVEKGFHHNFRNPCDLKSAQRQGLVDKSLVICSTVASELQVSKLK